MYQAAYNPIVYPVPGPDLWPNTGTPDIEPPVFRDKPGKKQTKRRKNQFEKPAPKDTSRMATITCSNCNLTGHRYTSCHKNLKPALAMRRNQHQVKSCVYMLSLQVKSCVYLILCSNLSICCHCRKTGELMHQQQGQELLLQPVQHQGQLHQLQLQLGLQLGQLLLLLLQQGQLHLLLKARCLSAAPSAPAPACFG